MRRSTGKGDTEMRGVEEVWQAAGQGEEGGDGRVSLSWNPPKLHRR
jgi:hypothetical protein